MPYLRFKGFAKDLLRRIAPLVIAEFSHLAKVPPEIVKIECLNIDVIANSPLSLEILMFPREPETHDRIAASLDRILREQGYPNVHIFFVLLRPEFYYKQGLPLVRSGNAGEQGTERQSTRQSTNVRHDQGRGSRQEL
ncbi:hypothetical protein BSNK01_29080 [Bacillaceae bacterium]